MLECDRESGGKGKEGGGGLVMSARLLTLGREVKVMRRRGSRRYI